MRGQNRNDELGTQSVCPFFDPNIDILSILAGETPTQCLQLERDIHPVIIIFAYNKTPKEAPEIIKRIFIPPNDVDDTQMLALTKNQNLHRHQFCCPMVRPHMQARIRCRMHRRHRPCRPTDRRRQVVRAGEEDHRG